MTDNLSSAKGMPECHSFRDWQFCLRTETMCPLICTFQLRKENLSRYCSRFHNDDGENDFNLGHFN